ncbi:MAG: hypothetical protein DRP47_04610 [Candidatus Zixiibacteriota bacterium]|nr:MAG: hypothetical protein DRP47_04610 [candidate division Zixibacteria bacterium]
MKNNFFLLILTIVLFGCTSTPESFDQLLTAGKKAFVHKKYSKARDYLGKAVAKQPSDHDVLYFLGLSYARDYLLDSAFFYISRADVLIPNDRETNLELYKLAMDLKEDKAAIKAIKVLIRTGDPEDQYYETLVRLHAREKHHYNAYHYSRLLLKKEPENRQWYLVAASAAANIDSIHVALEILDSAIEKFGPLPELRMNRALFLISINKYSEAERALRLLYAEDTASVPYRINLAHVLSSQDDRQKKQEAYDIYKSLEPLELKEFKLDSLISALEQELNQ